MSVVKEMFSRKRILPLLLILALIVFWYFRKPEPLLKVEGITFGSIAYHIQYKDPLKRNFTTSIDSLLKVFNLALSHYIPESELSRLNSGSGAQSYESPFLFPVLDLSRRIYDLSDGAYNPAIMPIVNAWGFGPDETMTPDSTTIDSLLAFSDFNLIDYDFEQVSKKDPRVQLDFSASAKGYAIDVIGHFLESKNITDYFVEIGGEVLCKGTNKQDNTWRIGIISPDSDVLTQHFYATANITNMAVATSANNFNYREIDGVKYSHTIDPATGYPAKRSILSASIFSIECMEADALATACMVMGIEKSIKMIEGLDGVEAMLLYSGERGKMEAYITDGIKPMINVLDQGKK